MDLYSVTKIHFFFFLLNFPSKMLRVKFILDFRTETTVIMQCTNSTAIFNCAHNSSGYWVVSDLKLREFISTSTYNKWMNKFPHISKRNRATCYAKNSVLFRTILYSIPYRVWRMAYSRTLFLQKNSTTFGGDTVAIPHGKIYQKVSYFDRFKDAELRTTKVNLPTSKYFPLGHIWIKYLHCEYM